MGEKIQDNPKNKTEFHLLENKMLIKPLNVGIIGINGRFGTLLANFFRALGCKVIGSDRKVPTNLTNIQVAEQADVLLFAIPIKRTVAAIEEIIPFTRPGQLLMDVTSVKGPVVQALLRSKSQVVGLHPMFAPELGFAGQTIVVCPARLDISEWKTWVVNVLASTGAKLKYSNPAEHDMYMATVQVSPQSATLINAVLIQEMGVSTKASLDFTSPFYRLQFSLMGRLLSQNAGMYASILMQNPATIPMLRARLKIERELLKIIETKDTEAFLRLFEKARDYFGPEIIRESSELFLRLNVVTRAIDSPNSVILEFATWDNKPRLLEKIGRAFGRRGVNITSISSVALNDRRIQFLVVLGDSKDATSVQRALKEITSWEKPLIQVVA